MKFFLTGLFCFALTPLFSQLPVGSATPSNPSPQVYALVVGISKYLQKDIPQLQFADRDAKVFADYLKSNAGGKVPAENIRLLVNEEATSSAVYDAIYWLKNICKKDDVVFFYFSGHGDVENVTMYKNGFLICYDSPPNNYVNLSLSVEYLNDIANTLSAQTQANVVLITDACHSGKLAGNKFKGSFLVGEQLKAVKNKEIRLTACAPDQLSNENEEWGGGRGVFSYYLVNGLKGLADKEKDGLVTLDEIKSYLDSSLAKDAILRSENIIQNPVLNGRGNFVLAKVDASEMKAAEIDMAQNRTTQNAMPANVMLSSENIPASPRDHLLYLLKKQSLEQLTDSLKLDEIAAEEIPFAIIGTLKRSITSEEQKNNINQYEKTLRENKDALKRFNGRLAVAFDEKGQQVIDQYLSGDAAELEKRRYYNINNNGYDVYTKMFDVALKLTQPDNYLYNILQVKLHYFAGVAARLRIPTVADPTPLIEKAFAEQNMALALEEHAAYIYNELGILHLYKKDYAVAEKHFLKATEIAPEWAIPWSNLIGIYAVTKNSEAAFQAVKKAKELQPEIQNIYVNEGILYEKQNNLLVAEELYRKSIQINSRHYFPFERLGHIFMNTTQYAAADSFFYEADIRKKGFHFHDEIVPLPLSMILAPHFEVPPCEINTRDVKKEDVMGNLVWALQSLRHGDSALAEEKFKWVIALDRSNPLAFHYLGKILYAQKRWKEGDIIFNLAIKYHLNTTSFYRYCDSLQALLPQSLSKICIADVFKKSYYNKIYDYYFLATLYEAWNHFTEAEEQYKKIIKFDPAYAGGYIRLWRMLENIGRYNNAENVIRSYAFHNKEIGDRELYGFYKRMCERFPEQAQWQYKMGLFLYQMASENKEGFVWDKKYIKPDNTEEIYVPNDPEALQDKNPFIELPGIKETISFVQSCKWPRTEGIQYLGKADSLLHDDDAGADINQMIGDLYVWQGLPARANLHYKVAVDIKPQDAATRLKLVDTYAATYLLRDALAQLDSLKNRNEINFTKQLLLAKYYIHSAKFTEADTLLKEAQKIHPYKIPEIFDLNGRLQLLSEHPKEALQFYNQLLTLNKKDRFTQYNISRLYAKLGNNDEAWKWLDASLKNGFNYSYVLQFDPYMEPLRTSAKWNSLIKNYPMKVYPPPAKSVLN